MIWFEDKIECKTCNIGYKLINGYCKVDYLIKVTYLSISQNEKINLMSPGVIYDITGHISLMIIDWDDFDPNLEYTFPDKGYHIIYYKYIKFILLETFPNEYMFYGIDRIMSVSFSDFDDYIPNINFKGLLASCTNLTSVDLSKVSFEMALSYNLKDMFNNCINLKHVNLWINILYVKLMI